MSWKVLIVEDDEAMAIALRDGFTYEGYEVVVAHDGVAALRATEHAALDLVILDVMMPKLSGLDVCRRLREKGNSVPIIMLTARGQEIDKVVGLKLGADDYVTKPFSFMELLARVEAVLRRARGGRARRQRERRDRRVRRRHVDFAHHEAHRDGCSLDLTPREFAMLDFFVKHRGEVVTREQLLDSVWGYTTIPFTRTVDTHVAKLRKKIEANPDEPRHLVTVHRLGYKFVG